MTTIGKEVRRLREARRMTQAGLAKKAAIARESVSRIEHGHVDPDPATVRRLASALRISAARLYAAAAGGGR